MNISPVVSLKVSIVYSRENILFPIRIEKIILFGERYKTFYLSVLLRSLVKYKNKLASELPKFRYTTLES